MNKIKILLLVMITFVMNGCDKSTNKIENELVFSREDFKETKTLSNPEEIVIKDLLYPASFRVMNDSLLIVDNQPVCDYLLEVYSLNSLTAVKRLINRGNGPGEMLSCSMSLHDNQNETFFLRDLSTNLCYVTDLSTLLQNNVFRPSSSFKLSSEISIGADICLMSDNRYVGCHMWYLEDPNFSVVDAPLMVLKRGEDNGKGINDYPFMVASVNGSLLFTHPDTNHIWSLDMHRDIIRIYNDSLCQIGSLSGPDNFRPSYTRKEIKAPVAFVTFEGEKFYTSYIDYYLTEKHIYLVYQGTEYFDPTNLLPVEIFKLDYSGNLLCNYKVDRYVYSISIDRSEKYLYCASRKSLEEPPTILKYTLNTK